MLAWQMVTLWSATCAFPSRCGLVGARAAAQQAVGGKVFALSLSVPCYPPFNHSQMCEQRDPKGLYKAARAGKIKGFTGGWCCCCCWH